MSDAPERYKDTWRNAVLNKAVDALDCIINDHDPEIDCPIKQGVWDHLDKLVLAFEERRADLPATDAQIAARLHECVKPLDWVDSYGVWRAATPFGDYKVAGCVLTLPLPMNPQQVHADEQAAKAAAEAHYTAQIMAALNLSAFKPSADPTVQALVNLLTRAVDDIEKGWLAIKGVEEKYNTDGSWHIVQDARATLTQFNPEKET